MALSSASRRSIALAPKLTPSILSSCATVPMTFDLHGLTPTSVTYVSHHPSPPFFLIRHLQLTSLPTPPPHTHTQRPSAEVSTMANSGEKKSKRRPSAKRRRSAMSSLQGR